jgi:TonB family protein
VTGVGDAVATAEPSRAPSADQPDTAPAPAADGAGAPSGARPAPRVDPHPEIARVDERVTRERGVGPLAAETGARSFDAEARGAVADVQTSRAASNERHPGLVDFSRPGVAGPGESADGRGPGHAPGASSLMTTGTAVTDYGARNADEPHTEVTVETGERVYDRYWQEVQRRVQLVLVFPKRLALRLEQGETVVSFAVRPDGWVGEGPRVVKSSGFQEFDAEAVKAVQRAAPFPRRNDIRRGTLTVTFENPLIR